MDDLLERAGCQNVIHLHGSIHRPYCENCKRPHALPAGLPDEPPGGRRLEPPTCEWCGGWIRPGVVWFGEGLPATAWEAAANTATSCDLMLCIGTSSLVYSAASLPRRTVDAGGKVIQINPQSTPLDELAEFNLRGKAGVILPLLCEAAWSNSPLESST